MTEYFVKNLIFFALTIAAAVAFRLVLAKTKFRGGKVGDVLKFPLSYRLAPLIFAAYFAVVALLVLLFAKGDYIYMIVAGIVAVAALPIALGWSLWKVEIGEDGFAFRNCFGIKHRYVYRDLELEEHPSGMKWYFVLGQKRVLCVRRFVRGGDRLKDKFDQRGK